MQGIGRVDVFRVSCGGFGGPNDSDATIRRELRGSKKGGVL